MSAVQSVLLCLAVCLVVLLGIVSAIRRAQDKFLAAPYRKVTGADYADGRTVITMECGHTVTFVGQKRAGVQCPQCNPEGR